VIPLATGNRLHPTLKLVAAMRTVLEALTRRCQLVLDPFCGSGSTLAAAQASGRDWLGYELDPRFYAVAADDWPRERPVFLISAFTLLR
jgi:site-specific DNA-methyltransferase (adenine-specific)